MLRAARCAPRWRVPLRARGFCKETMTRAEMEKVAQSARNQEKWTNALMPEKNWGIDHPATWALAVACLGLSL
jgi:hypothetical protein